MIKRRILPTLLLFVLFLGCARTSFATKVYITETDLKYHRSNCYSLRYSKIEILLKLAVMKGYTPCHICKPPVLPEEKPLKLSAREGYIPLPPKETP